MAGAMVGAAAWVGMRSPEAVQSMRSNIRPRGAHYLAPAASRQARQSRLPRQLLQHFSPPPSHFMYISFLFLYPFLLAHSF